MTCTIKHGEQNYASIRAFIVEVTKNKMSVELNPAQDRESIEVTVYLKGFKEGNVIQFWPTEVLRRTIYSMQKSTITAEAAMI